jgi:hypothetical protein
MLFSAFTPFGHLGYWYGSSRFQIIYESMRDGQDGAYGPNDVQQEARIYAFARCIAVAEGQLTRARNEGRPLKTQELLGELEHDFGVAYSPRQTEAERRVVLSLRERVLRGSRKESLDEALGLLLGADFVEAIPYKDMLTPPTQWPADPSTNGNYQLRALWRLYTVTECTALLGTRDLHVVDGVPGQEPLKTGDRVILDPANAGMAEAVTVVALLAEPSVDASNFTTNYVRVVIAKPHDAGVVATTAPFPLIISTQRHILVRVSAAATRDALTRIAINDLMRRMLPAVTTWEIDVADTGAPGSPDNLLLLDDTTTWLDGYVTT